MKKFFLLLMMFCFYSFAFSDNNNFWLPENDPTPSAGKFSIEPASSPAVLASWVFVFAYADLKCNHILSFQPMPNPFNFVPGINLNTNGEAVYQLLLDAQVPLNDVHGLHIIPYQSMGQSVFIPEDYCFPVTCNIQTKACTGNGIANVTLINSKNI